jgi:hypothetical protein
VYNFPLQLIYTKTWNSSLLSLQFKRIRAALTAIIKRAFVRYLNLGQGPSMYLAHRGDIETTVLMYFSRCGEEKQWPTPVITVYLSNHSGIVLPCFREWAKPHATED